ncbi:formyltransferase family protein [Cohnella sp. 56]|uniref:formyltransferase family protein n=1 Tax=Cohnella sp. 56 TaxID=3113722 RepID=UPI0030EA5A75
MSGETKSTKSNKKLLCLFATEKGYVTLEKALQQGFRENIGCVISYQDKQVSFDYEQKIYTLCKEYEVPYYNWFKNKDKLPEIIFNHTITGAVAVSWQYLIDLKINSLLQDKVIVFHDSLLPKYRGFAPTPTAMICGEEEIGISAIFAEEAVDSGDIVLQKKMRISGDDYIKHIITKQSLLYAEAFVDVLYMMKNENIISYPQDEEQATYSIWRSIEDCRINWSESSEKIYALIRAVGNPYHGAFTFYNEKKVIVNTAEVAINDMKFAIRDYGKIWTIEEGAPVVICGKGMLKITDAVFETGEKVQFEKLRVRFG